MMNYGSRKIFVGVNKIRKIFSLSSTVLFIVSVGGYSIAFLTLKPDSSLFFMEKPVSPYLVMNISLFFIVISVLSYIFVNLTWLFTRNSPPVVYIKPASPLGNRKFAYVEIQNNEPHGIKSIRLKILSLKDKDGINRISHFEERTDIKKIIDSSKNQKVEIPILEGNDGAVWVLVDKRPEALMARNQHENYEIVFDLYAKPNKEGQELFVGTYSGKFGHDKLIDVNQDTISWMIKDFVKNNKKSVLQS